MPQLSVVLRRDRTPPVEMLEVQREVLRVASLVPRLPFFGLLEELQL